MNRKEINTHITNTNIHQEKKIEREEEIMKEREESDTKKEIEKEEVEENSFSFFQEENYFNSFNSEDLNPIYRSIQFDTIISIPTTFPTSFSLSSPSSSSSLPYTTTTTPTTIKSIPLLENKKNFLLNIQEIKVPKLPFYVGYSNFNLILSIEEIIQRVQHCLNQIIELDYQFIQQLCKVSS